VTRWIRYAAGWPAIKLRLVRNPDTCARHDAVMLTSQELATWHAVHAQMRPSGRRHRK
jgi:hypothetical protein